MKSVATGVQVPTKPPPTSPLHLPKDCHRSLGDLKVSLKCWERIQKQHFPRICSGLSTSLFFPQVTRGLVARFLQRSKRNLSVSSEHAASTGQGPKRRNGAEGATNYLPIEQVRQVWSSVQSWFSPSVSHAIYLWLNVSMMTSSAGVADPLERQPRTAQPSVQ